MSNNLFTCTIFIILPFFFVYVKFQSIASLLSYSIIMYLPYDIKLYIVFYIKSSQPNFESIMNAIRLYYSTCTCIWHWNDINFWYLIDHVTFITYHVTDNGASFEYFSGLLASVPITWWKSWSTITHNKSTSLFSYFHTSHHFTFHTWTNAWYVICIMNIN